MAKAKDPVCGMMIGTDTARERSTYQGQTYYFCSVQCLGQFEADPVRYVRSPVSAAADPASRDELERHEPPHTTSGGITAPKFGAAGSGGAEYERLPEAHDDREGGDR